MPDYDKLHKLNKDTVNRMTDKNCDPEKEMAKYKKQRNILLGAGAAVTISLGVALMKIKNLKGQCDESIKSLSKAVDELEIANRKYDQLERVSEGNKKGFSQLLELEAEKNKKLTEKNKKLTEMVNDRDKTIGGLNETIYGTLRRNDKIRKEVMSLKHTISKKIETMANISKEDANDYVNALKEIWNLMRLSAETTISDHAHAGGTV